MVSANAEEGPSRSARHEMGNNHEKIKIPAMIVQGGADVVNPLESVRTPGG